MHTGASEVKEAELELSETTDASLLATRMEAGEEVLVHYGQFLKASSSAYSLA